MRSNRGWLVRLSNNYGPPVMFLSISIAALYFDSHDSYYDMRLGLHLLLKALIIISSVLAGHLFAVLVWKKQKKSTNGI